MREGRRDGGNRAIPSFKILSAIAPVLLVPNKTPFSGDTGQFPKFGKRD